MKFKELEILNNNFLKFYDWIHFIDKTQDLFKILGLYTYSGGEFNGYIVKHDKTRVILTNRKAGIIFYIKYETH